MENRADMKITIDKDFWKKISSIPSYKECFKSQSDLIRVLERNDEMRNAHLEKGYIKIID